MEGYVAMVIRKKKLIKNCYLMLLGSIIHYDEA